MTPNFLCRLLVISHLTIFLWLFCATDAKGLCPDGIIDLGETCDDGNTVGCDGCSTICRVSGCGDGDVCAGEQCDDANNVGGDGCSATCQFESLCGNGAINSGEQCDDGNASNTDACKTNCTLNVCGDGFIYAGVEQCDDGNNSSNDGCSATCRTENLCGNGFRNGSEQCDDGNGIQTDACKNDCTFNVCGDGIIDSTDEQCDDGNLVPGDSCENFCHCTSRILLPATVSTRGFGFGFFIDVFVPGSCVLIDPLYAIGYDYLVEEGSTNFESVVLPAVGDDLLSLYLFDAAASEFVFDRVISAGVAHVFAPGGVDRFRILGIEQSAALDPTDPLAFVTGMSFVSGGPIALTMTPVTSCPHVPDATPKVLTALKRANLNYSKGAGGRDDKLKVASGEFETSATFDPATSHSVHITLTNPGTGGVVFGATLAASSGFCTQPTSSKKLWRYKDPGTPTVVGLKTALIKESPSGSGRYKFKLSGRDASFSAADTPVTGLHVLLEIEDAGVGVCFEAGLSCRSKRAGKDQCKL